MTYMQRVMTGCKWDMSRWRIFSIWLRHWRETGEVVLLTLLLVPIAFVWVVKTALLPLWWPLTWFWAAKKHAKAIEELSRLEQRDG